MAVERLQKLLARAGIASRRKAEELITGGRVRVDGRIVTELGTKASSRARIEVDGAPIAAEQFCYGILHKPRQMVTTLADPEGRATVHDILRKVGVRVIPVGRLDFNTSGALLFTNDGDFAQVLQHARGNVPKVYVAKVQGELDDKQVERWRDSIEIEGKRTRPADVRALRRENGNTWLEITLTEGKNRQVRRLGEHAGANLIRLARMSQAGISTDGLRVGEYRLLTNDELKELKKLYGVPKKIRGAMEEGDRPKTNVRGRTSPKATGLREKSGGRRPSLGTPEARPTSGRGAKAVGRGGRPSFARGAMAALDDALGFNDGAEAPRGRPGRGGKASGRPSFGAPSEGRRFGTSPEGRKFGTPPEGRSTRSRTGETTPSRGQAVKKTGAVAARRAEKVAQKGKSQARAQSESAPVTNSRGRSGRSPEGRASIKAPSVRGRESSPRPKKRS